MYPFFKLYFPIWCFNMVFTLQHMKNLLDEHSWEKSPNSVNIIYLDLCCPVGTVILDNTDYMFPSQKVVKILQRVLMYFLPS